MAEISAINNNEDHLSLNECLFSHALNSPTHNAVVTPLITLSYLELATVVAAQAELFYNAGISNQSIVGIQCADEVKHFVICLAAIYVGCTIFTIPTFEKDQARKIISKNSCVDLIIDENLAVNLFGYSPKFIPKK